MGYFSSIISLTSKDDLKILFLFCTHPARRDNSPYRPSDCRCAYKLFLCSEAFSVPTDAPPVKPNSILRFWGNIQTFSESFFFDSASHFLSVFAEKKLLTNLRNRVKWEAKQGLRFQSCFLYSYILFTNRHHPMMN